MVIPAVPRPDARTRAPGGVPSTRLREKRSRRDRRAVAASKIVVGLVALLAFVGTGGAWGMKAWYNSKFNQVAALDENSADIQDGRAQLGDENFLIIGSDTRAGAAEDDKVGSEEAIPGARSDTVMVAHVPKDRGRAVLISFPRDLEVTRPACARWDAKTGEYGGEVLPEAPAVKLNTVYQYGGPKCAIKLIQKMTGMRMNHFVSIDFHGFKEMVDAVGGVSVEVDEPIVDRKLGEIVPQPGVTELDGKRALLFVRARTVLSDVSKSDYDRIRRQQQFISALMHKTMSRDVLLNPRKLTGFVTAFANATTGDGVGVDELLTLAKSMKSLDSDTITFLTVPTTGWANERGNEVLIEEQADEIFRALIDNGRLPGDEDEQRSAQARTARGGEPTGTP